MTNEDKAFLAGTPMAIWLENGGVKSANCFVIGGNAAQDLIEPDRVIQGRFRAINPSGDVFIPFTVVNPTQRQVADTLNAWYETAIAEYPLGDHIFIEDRTKEDNVITFYCGS